MRGAWVEIHSEYDACGRHMGRSPCGERGLKLLRRVKRDAGRRSLPVRGAWVEILLFPFLDSLHRRSPCGERGLKSASTLAAISPFRSLPVRGAWVEMNDRSRFLPSSNPRSPCGERGLK